jgi:oligoribonuclease NrnB/cAMP/cGMP phosphodiesterase (DHH superfamily)
MKPLCIYHGGCDDGFAAAWCVRAALGSDVEFYPGAYAKEPPDVTGRDVLMVDFSYKRPVLDLMSGIARSMLILDHHKTAQEDMSGVPRAPSWDRWKVWDDPVLDSGLGPYRRAAIFDMDRSGAGIAWDYFIGDGAAIGLDIHTAKRRREFIDYIQDRDLWRKTLPDGDEFTIALRSYPQDFAKWDELIADGPARLIDEGRVIQRYYRLRVEELKRHAYPARLGGHDIYITNAPYFAASEVAGELCDRGGAFGACYFEVEGGRFQYSLRSRGDFDVSAVAKKYGGGGHKNAAGFTTNGKAHA